MKIKPFLLFLSVLSTVSVLESQWVQADTVKSREITGGVLMEKGELSLDFASRIDFGRNRISNKDMVYYAEPQHVVLEDGATKDVPHYVQITDNRGSNAGWHLQVKQERQLENPNTRYKVLTGAEIRLTEPHVVSNQSGDPSLVTPKTPPVVLIPGQTSEVMQAPEGSGGGTWQDVFGHLQRIKIDQAEVLKNTSITLSLPGKTPKDAVTYKSRLTWTLIDAPKV
ncbi:WxL domain-containing protein [Lactococcus garvieae]|uniref:WxL domain-containing protein n=1 Tax=Lactococcus garvieae TaxID=1363 RepID=UPI00030FE8D9|nr:WxL domain-containing protein [Lactococcus garvieae]